MANFVIKKDGTKEPFDAEKIRKAIAYASKTANLSEEETARVVGEVSTVVLQSLAAKEEVTSTEIKGEILAKLDALEPSISEAWRKYEQGKQKVQ